MDGMHPHDLNPAKMLVRAFTHQSRRMEIQHSSNAAGAVFTHFILDINEHMDPNVMERGVKLLDRIPVKLPNTGLPENTKGWSHLDKREYLDIQNAGLCQVPLRAEMTGQGKVELTLEGTYDRFPTDMIEQALGSHAARVQKERNVTGAEISR